MLSRWQFGITTVYHFLFVPLTIGLAFSVAGFQTAWYRTGREEYLRLTRFFGELFLINFAIGVVTGIVQEFQFGMNWSSYSRFVGDIFGAPLAIEGLLAFFLESTFLGLWIFGWGRLGKRVHLATIWVAAIGTVLSAYFILAANSWMQHPVGYTVNPVTGRAELTDFLALLTNSTALITFPHTIAAAFMTTGAFIAGIAMYRMLTDRRSARGRRALPVGREGRCRDAPGVRPARGGHGRHPGQDHDRAAADEDGGGRGALGDGAAGLVLDLHDRHARTGRRTSSRSGSRTCSRSSQPAPSTARSRASTTSRRSRRRGSGPGTTRPTPRSRTGHSGG